MKISIKAMLVHQTVSMSKQAPSRREVIACWRVTLAKLPNIPPLSQENMDQLKQPLLELIFSPTRNVKIHAQLLTTSKSPTWLRMNLKLLMLLKMILLTWSSMMVPWNNWSYQIYQLMKLWTLNWKNCGRKTTKKLKFISQLFQQEDKRRSFQEDVKKTIDTIINHSLNMFEQLLIYLMGYWLDINWSSQQGASINGGSCEFEFGCFSRICWARDPSDP